MDKAKLCAALAKLDTANDDHWTNAGLVKLAALEAILGEDITREALQEHGPEGFERDTAKEIVATFENVGDLKEAGTIEAEQKAEEAMTAEEGPDAIALFEAAVAACMTDAFRENRELQDMAKAWMARQKQARAWQERINQKRERKAKLAAQAKAEAEAAQAE